MTQHNPYSHKQTRGLTAKKITKDTKKQEKQNKPDTSNHQNHVTTERAEQPRRNKLTRRHSKTPAGVRFGSHQAPRGGKETPTAPLLSKSHPPDARKESGGTGDQQEGARERASTATEDEEEQEKPPGPLQITRAKINNGS